MSCARRNNYLKSSSKLKKTQTHTKTKASKQTCALRRFRVGYLNEYKLWNWVSNRKWTTKRSPVLPHRFETYEMYKNKSFNAISERMRQDRFDSFTNMYNRMPPPNAYENSHLIFRWPMAIGLGFSLARWRLFHKLTQ